MESKGLKINTGKTKVMVGGEGLGKVEVTCKYPCDVCGKGVGRNSLQCTSCEKWIHKRCSGVKGSLQKASASFECRMCKERSQVTNIAKQNGDIGKGVELEKVGKFCYLGDMLDAEGSADLAVATRVSCA
jgi:hypothetical protein